MSRVAHVHGIGYLHVSIRCQWFSNFVCWRHIRGHANILTHTCIYICAKQLPYLLTCSCFLFCLLVEVAFDTLFVACGLNVKDDICSLFRAAFTFSPSPYWTLFHNPANAHAAIGAVSVLFSFLSICSGTMVVNFGLFHKRKWSVLPVIINPLSVSQAFWCVTVS